MSQFITIQGKTFFIILFTHMGVHNLKTLINTHEFIIIYRIMSRSNYVSFKNRLTIVFLSNLIIIVIYIFFLHISVGQCGNQIGSAFWPLVLHEYGIQTTSSEINFLKTQKNYNKNINDLCDAFNSFFYVPKFNSDLAFKTVSELVSAKVKARVGKFLNFLIIVLIKDFNLILLLNYRQF